MRVLLVEDDLQLGKALQKVLKQSDFTPEWVRRCQEARAFLQVNDYAVVLLDLRLPDGSGLDILSNLRDQRNKVPVLILTARDAIGDRVKGLDAGADDYLTKPFAIPELLSRIHALIRRSAGFVTQAWTIGAVRIDPSKHQVWLAEDVIELSPREYQILFQLIRNAGRVITRTQLEDGIYELDAGIESNALEVHIHHLRKKLGESFIKTIRGVGYLIET
jgi:DNA-binding response OmpR family regulator